jgi:phosphatidylserine/phosphatidylglycerophosphate/cardiolipin synthase-like enzyme
MRVLAKAKRDFEVLAISGTRCVMLAINCPDARRRGLLGFAIEREVTGPASKARWLPSGKFFKSVLDKRKETPKTYSGKRDTSVLPIQSFIWSDYFFAEPATLHKYRLTPMYGTPDHLTTDPDDEVRVAIRTEKEFDGKHGVWFNRGAIASQYFAKEFHNKAPKNIEDPKDPEVVWLSRGLLEACLDYIRQTPKGDALRVAAYEFTYAPVLQELQSARKRGVDVRIVYHDTTKLTGSEKDANEKAMKAAGLPVNDQKVTFRRSKPKIPHNKFIVRLKNGTTPVEVWTGSTNFTASGFLGQTNVGHRVADPATAKDYLSYWSLLKDDPDASEARAGTLKLTPDPAEAIAGKSIVRFFSPRAKSEMLGWYGRRMLDAASAVCFTAAFGVNAKLMAPISVPRNEMRFVLMEKPAAAPQQKEFKRDLTHLQVTYGVPLGQLYKIKNGRVTTRAHIKPFELEKWFFKEEHFRSSGHVFFVHTKFLLIDPLSDDPLVCTGSANFSPGSLLANDENMLFIRGDTRVADIYLTEFDRINRHFYFRDVANELHGKGDTKSIYLEETDKWTDSDFLPGHLKTNRRLMFFAKPTTKWSVKAAAWK